MRISRPLRQRASASRFRHAAAYRQNRYENAPSGLPLLSDGGGNATSTASASSASSASSSSSAAAAASLKLPVVTLLLPTAALHGVVSPDEDDDSHDGLGSASASASDLTQVQCQVLNASRLRPTAVSRARA